MKNKRKKRKVSSDNKSLTRRKLPLNKLSTDTVSEFKKALQYHQSGQLQKAEEIYQKILHINPNHADSLHLLGVIAYQVGKIDTAVILINKAIQNNPKNPYFYNNLGNALKDQGKLNKAISHYQKALELKQDYAEAYNNLGNTFKDQGKLNEAISSCKKALKLKPDLPEAYNNMGSAYKDQKKLTDAVLCYQKALEIKPEYAEAHNNLGIAFKDQGKINEAVSCFKKALTIKPNLADVNYNLGNALKDQGRLREAISSYQKTLKIKPDFAEAYNNMGAIFQEREKSNIAISCYQKALEFKPDYAEVYYNLASMLKDQGKVEDAISCLQKALDIKPDYSDAYSNLFHQLQQTCDWQKLEDMTAKLDEFTTKDLSNGTKTAEAPFVSLARYTNQSRYFEIAKSWSNDIDRTMSTLKIHFPHDVKKSHKTKIIVGYLSKDFRNHPMAHLTLNLYGLHNRKEFKVFCYSYGEDDGSYYRTRIREDCDKFIDLRKLSPADSARRIYEDQVDILVDFKGYTGGSRLEISALRPAPVQVRYLGLVGTTGANFFDYIITDIIVTPKEHSKYYSENFAYMPHCYQINDHTQKISEKAWKKTDFGLPEDSFVFCSFNQGYKIEPVMFNSWMNILRQVPESVLWLQRMNKTAEINLKGEAEARKVKPDRLIFADKLPKCEHLARLRLADMALDTRIVNGIITTSDALWAGVPVITLQGSSFVSRVSSSILTAIGLPKLVTRTLEEYESLAIDLAHDTGKLQKIRQKIINNRLVEPLFDTPRFVKNLENAYKEMWKVFITGENPRQIKVVES